MTKIYKRLRKYFCDDVTTELADISLGDAWLNPYDMYGAGTNVIVTRSQLAEELINAGIKSKELSVEPLALEAFLSSQQGSFNHRHKGLGYRGSLAEKRGMTIPPKRHDKEKISLDFKWVQDQRMRVRKLSIVEWIKLKDSNLFDDAMSVPREKLKRRTKIYHYIRAIERRFHL